MDLHLVKSAGDVTRVDVGQDVLDACQQTLDSVEFAFNSDDVFKTQIGEQGIDRGLLRYSGRCHAVMTADRTHQVLGQAVEETDEVERSRSISETEVKAKQSLVLLDWDGRGEDSRDEGKGEQSVEELHVGIGRIEFDK